MKDSSANINNNTIKGNTVTKRGGGIWATYCDATSTIENNSIHGNTAEAGSGIYLYMSNTAISNNTITNNTAASSGGGIWLNVNSSPSINKNIITNNMATIHGGGIWVNWTSSPSIGGADASDTGNFNTICGNIPNQIEPGNHPNNDIDDVCD